MRDTNKENEIARLTRAVWGDNAVEYLVGSLSSLCSENQLDTLIAELDKQATNKMSEPKFDYFGLKKLSDEQIQELERQAELLDEEEK